MDWQEVCSKPELRNLPYKIELNEWGKIVMTPTYGYHGGLQQRIADKLGDLLGRTTLTECPIQTSKGTKVADVVWASPERYDIIFDAKESPIAPEICVEILSDSNTAAEMQDKKQLYFERGCQEFWTCNKDGIMHFYDSQQELDVSRLATKFPKHIQRRG